MSQQSSELLRELLEKYNDITHALNASIDVATELNNKLAVAKSEVAKNKNLQKLIEQSIQSEKLLIQASR